MFMNLLNLFVPGLADSVKKHPDVCERVNEMQREN